MLILSAFSCIAICCCLAFALSLPRSPHEQKIEKALRKKLDKLQLSDGTREVRVIGDCGMPVTEKMARMIARRGIKIIAVFGAMFVAKGTVEQIRMLSRMSLVTQLRLSIRDSLGGKS